MAEGPVDVPEDDPLDAQRPWQNLNFLPEPQ
jgi:hypothetical protein